ncbi:MAG: hypothetical protein SynsKO_35920 [Synoicihabitans sp.]
MRTVQSSLAIEGNTLSLDQVTALLDGKRVIAAKKDIREMLNANDVYEQHDKFDPFSKRDLLSAHKIMMRGLLKTAGQWRRGGVGIVKGNAVSHVAPPADRVPYLIDDLFRFLTEETHPLPIRASVFHYELEFIHPFEDGNGRLGRFWHTLMLTSYHEVFQYIPVESLIRDQQQDYYAALESSDRRGEATPFIETSLAIIARAFTEFLDELKPEPLTPEARLRIAAAHFGKLHFSRKIYVQHFKTISTATASRDLRDGVNAGLLVKQGTGAQTTYLFIT